MRRRPDPLQRIASLQHCGPMAVVDLPPIAIDDDEQEQADPPVRTDSAEPRVSG
jgi:hypothetical protein